MVVIRIIAPEATGIRIGGCGHICVAGNEHTQVIGRPVGMPLAEFAPIRIEVLSDFAQCETYTQKTIRVPSLTGGGSVAIAHVIRRRLPRIFQPVFTVEWREL